MLWLFALFLLGNIRVSDGLTCYECRDPKKKSGNCPGVSTVTLGPSGHRCRILSSGNFTVSQGIVQARLCESESLKISLVNLRQVYKYYGGEMRATCCDYDLCNTFESAIKNLILGERRKSWKENYQILGSKYKKKQRLIPPSTTTEHYYHHHLTTESPQTFIYSDPPITPKYTEVDYAILENDIEPKPNEAEPPHNYFDAHPEEDYREEINNGFFEGGLDPRDPNVLLRASLKESKEGKGSAPPPLRAAFNAVGVLPLLLLN